MNIMAVLLMLVLCTAFGGAYVGITWMKLKQGDRSAAFICGTSAVGGLTAAGICFVWLLKARA